MEGLPRAVRMNIWLFRAGMIVAGVGVVGFIASFAQIAAPAQAAIDVHEQVPVLAYASIAAWVVGLAVMWRSRRVLDAALREKLAEDREAMFVGLGDAFRTPADGAPATVESPGDARKTET
jgi:hypothetical protein